MSALLLLPPALRRAAARGGLWSGALRRCGPGAPAGSRRAFPGPPLGPLGLPPEPAGGRCRRHFATKGGGGGGPGEGGLGEQSGTASFPDSWVEPEALCDWAQHHAEQSKGNPALMEEFSEVDDAFAADFGRRNMEWRERMLAQDPQTFTRLGKGQAPKYLWIGCCDSRVAAEQLVNGRPGEIFVHRNIANMVVSTDANLRAVLHYAVDYLQVEHLIVCGHYDCGGVKAALANRDHASPVENWLTQVRDVYRMHHDELEAIACDDSRHKRLVELNVIEQCLNLFKTREVQRRRCYTAQRPEQYHCAYPRIHGMVFAPSDGILRRLPIDFKHYMEKWKRVYQIHDMSDYLASYVTP